MKNRKIQIRRTATAATLIALLLLGMSFFADGLTNGDNTEMVENAYGRAMFGGRFGWLDSVKRPGINAGVSGTGAGILGFNFSGDPSLAKRIVDPSVDIQNLINSLGVANASGLTVGGNSYPGGLPGLVRVEQVHLGPLSFDDGGSSNGFSGLIKDPNDPYSDPDPDPPVVPAPGAISLALIGLAGISAVRRKRN